MMVIMLSCLVSYKVYIALGGGRLWLLLIIANVHRADRVGGCGSSVLCLEMNAALGDGMFCRKEGCVGREFTPLSELGRHKNAQALKR